MARLCALLLLSCLWAGCRAQAPPPPQAELAPQPELAPDGGQGCQARLNFSSVFMPPEAKLLWRMHVEGTRNYSCVVQSLSFGPAQGLGKLTGDFNCSWFYTSPYVGIVDCPADPAAGKAAARFVLDTTLQGSVFVLPAPEPGNDPWGRFKIEASGAMAPANYAIRYNTSGGTRPQQCTAPRGEWVAVPFSATVEGYECR